MDYLSWFVKDATHVADLQMRINAKLGDQKVRDEIRLILVVSDVSERVKNACYVINCPVRIFSYSVFKLDNGELGIGPRHILDTSEGDSLIINRPVPSLQEMVPEQFQKLWVELDAYLRAMPRVQVYNTRIDIRARSSKVFARMIFQKRYLILRLLMERGTVKSPRFNFDKQEDSNFGNIRIAPSDAIDDEIKQWINASREFADSGGSYDSSAA